MKSGDEAANNRQEAATASETRWLRPSCCQRARRDWANFFIEADESERLREGEQGWLTPACA